MKNTFGTSLQVTLFGESHGPFVGAVLDGLASGIPVDESAVADQLALRRPWGDLGTPRRERDAFQIVSGTYGGYTTGTPLCILIPNEDVNSADYESVRDCPRPGHADYAARCKYRGYQDFRGGGHFSGRLTAPLVAAGALVRGALAEKGVVIGTHIARCGGAADRPFGDLSADLAALADRPFPVLDGAAAEEMQQRIRQAAARGDSVGGVLETAVLGLESGIGEPWFDTLEGLLSHALFSIPAVKGVEFGSGFAMAEGMGSAYNDSFALEKGRVVTRTNHNGGVNGGVSNGMPILFRCAVKPTPSIAAPQQTVDLRRMEETVLRLQGRHDPAIVHRARAAVDAVTALVLYDLLTQRHGTDYFGGETR